MRWLLLVVVMLAAAAAAEARQSLPLPPPPPPEAPPYDVDTGNRPDALQQPSPSGGDGQRQDKAIAAQDHGPSYAGEHGTDSAPLSVKIVNAGDIQPRVTPNPEATKENTPPEWWPWPDIWPHPDWALNGLTLCLVVIGGVQIGVFGLQARRLRQTIDTMKQIDQNQSATVVKSIAEATRAATAMENVAQAMRDNAAAANTTATEAGRTARSAARQARAIVNSEIAKVFIEGIAMIRVGHADPVVIPPGPLPELSQVMLIFSNTGKTRGTIDTIDIGWKVTKMEELLPSDLRLPGDGLAGLHYVVRPDTKGGVPCSRIIRLDQNELRDIKSGERRLWVYGHFTATDIMETHDHVGFVAFWEAVSQIDARQPTIRHPPRGFVRDGPPQYQFERRIEDKDWTSYWRSRSGDKADL